MSAERLTPELLTLMEHEKAIESHLDGIGWSLTRIRDGALYRAVGYDTFEDYCRERWHRSRRWAYQLMAAAEVIETVCAMAHTEPPKALPTSERQVRPLVPLRDDPEALRAAWDEAVEQADSDQPTAGEVAAAVATTRARRTLDKRPPAAGVPAHPAPFSEVLLPVMADLLGGFRRILDPFAGTGRIHSLADLLGDVEIVGVEIEPEWAACHPNTQIGDALNLGFDDGSFDAICTSPTYGNRLADHHQAVDPESRRSYTHDLGRPLAPTSSGTLQWGFDYREFHRQAWKEAARVLTVPGRLVLNIKDHIRDGAWQDVAGWHVATLQTLGFRIAAIRPVVTGSLPAGANRAVRADAELVIAADLERRVCL